MSCRPSEGFNVRRGFLVVFVRCVCDSPGERLDTRSESESEVCMWRERVCVMNVARRGGQGHLGIS